jgi:hypothetical protein
MRVQWGFRLALIVAVATLIAEVDSMVGRSIAGSDGTAPEIHGAVWINGGPTSKATLRGKVVLVEFWTYG